MAQEGPLRFSVLVRCHTGKLRPALFLTRSGIRMNWSWVVEVNPTKINLWAFVSTLKYVPGGSCRERRCHIIYNWEWLDCIEPRDKMLQYNIIIKMLHGEIIHFLFFLEVLILWIKFHLWKGTRVSKNNPYKFQRTHGYKKHHSLLFLYNKAVQLCSLRTAYDMATSIQSRRL